MTPELKFKRGDTVTHTLVIPELFYKTGLKVFFMAKEEIDDDTADAKAVIKREFGDSNIIAKENREVVYELKFLPGDTNNIKLDGETRITLQGEFEFRYADGQIKTFPETKPLKVIVYSDVRRGNG